MTRQSRTIAKDSSSILTASIIDFVSWSRSLQAFVILISASGCRYEFESEILSSDMRGFHAVYSEHALDSNRYIVYTPHGERAADCEPLPVFVFLHGNGENGKNGLTQLHNNFGVEIDYLQEYHPFIAVCVQTSSERLCPAGGEQIERVLKILDDVVEEFNADPNRVILTGASRGASETWGHLADIPDRFAAAVSVSGSGGDDMPRAIADAGIPFWVIYNAGDTYVAPNCRENVRQLLEFGASPLVTEYQNKGHNAWSKAYLSKSMYAWCLEQNRNRREPQFCWVTRENLLQPQIADSLSSRRESVAEGSVQGWEFDDSEDDGFVATSETLGTIALPSGHKSKEVHFSMWPSATTASRIGIFVGAGADAPDCMVTFRDVHTGWTDLTGPLGKWLARLDVVTQQQLTAGEWNDVRLAIFDQHLHIRINGWKADPLHLPSASGDLQIRLMPPETGRTRFRYVRYRLDENADLPSERQGAAE